MSEKETKILDTFGKAIPKLSELEKEKLLADRKSTRLNSSHIH